MTSAGAAAVSSAAAGAASAAGASVVTSGAVSSVAYKIIRHDQDDGTDGILTAGASVAASTTGTCSSLGASADIFACEMIESDGR